MGKNKKKNKKDKKQEAAVETMGVEVMKHLIDEAGDEAGDFQADSTIGPVKMKKSEGGRKTFYVDDKCIPMKDLKQRFIDAGVPAPTDPKGPEQEKPPAEFPTPEMLPEGTDEKKFKKKAVIKAINAYAFLKKKQKKALFELWGNQGKKITGATIMRTLQTVSPDLPSGTIVKFFESL